MLMLINHIALALITGGPVHHFSTLQEDVVGAKLVCINRKIMVLIAGLPHW